MADTNTSQFSFINPELKTKGWGVKLDQNRAILDAILWNQKNDGVLTSGGDVSIDSGLDLDVADLFAWGTYIKYKVSGSSKTCIASSVNYIYENAGSVTCSTTPPSANKSNLLAIAITDASSVLFLIDTLYYTDMPLLDIDECINGTLDWWDYGTSTTSNGFNTANRLKTSSTGSSVFTFQQQSFTRGQTDVPDDLGYYGNMSVQGGGGATDNVFIQYASNTLRSWANKRVCIDMWAKASSSALSMSLEGKQHFGSTGDTSVEAISVGKYSLTTSWQNIVHFIDWPSISGKTVSGGIPSSRIVFWFDAGSDYNARTDSLGSQTGTISIAHIQMYQSDRKLNVKVKDAYEQRKLCDLYHQDINVILGTDMANGTDQLQVHFPRMVQLPSLSLSSTVGGTFAVFFNGGFRATVSSTAFGQGTVSLDAEL